MLILWPLYRIALVDDLVERLFKQLIASRERLISVIHPRATIAPDASIGVGAVIFAGVVVNTGSVIGNNVVLNTGCMAESCARRT
jgi:UDP-3-O-[3-hydroxymyristoyl] glucosamine N-acyltransferase